MDTPSRDEMIDSLINLRTHVGGSGGMAMTASGLIPASKAKDVAAELRSELLELDHDSLKSRYDAFVDAQRKRAEAAEAEHSFNKPHARANFDHWAKMEYWTVDEGIALLLGRSPHALIWDNVKHISSPVIWQFASIREAATRAVNWKTLHTANRPGAFILWARRFEYPVPEELEAKVRKFGHFMGDWYSNFTELQKNYDALKQQYDTNTEKLKQGYDRIIAQWQQQYRERNEASTKNHNAAMRLLQHRDTKIAQLEEQVDRLEKELKDILKEKKPLGQREGDTLRKLVIGLAIEGYGYDPNAARSEAPTEIARDLQLRGLEITDDTVRKHLKQSAELLPSASPEQSRNKL